MRYNEQILQKNQKHPVSRAVHMCRIGYRKVKRGFHMLFNALICILSLLVGILIGQAYRRLKKRKEKQEKRTKDLLGQVRQTSSVKPNKDAAQTSDRSNTKNNSCR